MVKYTYVDLSNLDTALKFTNGCEFLIAKPSAMGTGDYVVAAFKVEFKVVNMKFSNRVDTQLTLLKICDQHAYDDYATNNGNSGNAGNYGTTTQDFIKSLNLSLLIHS